MTSAKATRERRSMIDIVAAWKVYRQANICSAALVDGENPTIVLKDQRK